MKPTLLPAAYGNLFCPYCFLTIVEFVNGHLYPLSPEQHPYLHDVCFLPFQKGGSNHATR